MSLRGVKYVSLHEASGYGVAARRTILSLRDAGVPVTWMPMMPGSWGQLWYRPFRGRAAGDPELDALCNRPIEYDVVVIHTVPEYFPALAAMEGNRRLISSTVWETTRVPAHWPELLAQPHQLIVPCAWNREVFRQAGVVVPIDIVPHPLGTEPLPAREALPGIRPDDFVFYSVCVWTARKALERTVEAFLRAFTSDDPVVLVIKTTARDQTRDGFLQRFLGSTRRTLGSITKRFPRPARVVLITQRVTEDDIRRLHARGDCYVSLARSEGWGLGAYDAAGFGRPLIVTGYGGHLEFLPAGYPYLVDHHLVPVDGDRGRRSSSPDQIWAEPSIEHGSRLMREVFDGNDVARHIGEALGEYVRTHFSGPIVTNRLLDALGRRAA